MIEPSITFVRVPKSIWNSYPADRTFAAAAEDLIGMERKIDKGVQLSLEAFRHHHLSVLVESRALDAIAEKKLPHLVIVQSGYDAYRRMLFKLYWNIENVAITTSPISGAAFHQSEIAYAKELRRTIWRIVMESLPFDIFQAFHRVCEAQNNFRQAQVLREKERTHELRLSLKVSGVSTFPNAECRKLCAASILTPGRNVALLQRMLEFAPRLQGFANEFRNTEAAAAQYWAERISTFLAAAVEAGDAVFVLHGTSLIAEERKA